MLFRFCRPASALAFGAFLAAAASAHAQDAGVPDAGASPGPAASSGAGHDAAHGDSGAPHGEAPAPPAVALALEPPRLVEAPPPEYPPERMAEGTEPTVVLHVLVGADGHVRDAHVEASMGADFDAAAAAAVERWTFAPARRGTQPVASRVRIAVHFTLPEVEVTQPDEAPFVERHAPRRPASPRVPSHPAAAAPAPQAFGARASADVVAAERRDQSRTGSDVVIDRDLLEAAPHADAGELLRTAPGVYVARPEGDAVAHQIMLRGFDAEHGQDLAISAGGIPLNQPSHLHGQGYADLGFVIPEVVRALRVTEGVYDPHQGDFAVAGSIDLELGMRERGLLSRTTYGSFGTFRQLLAWAPVGEREETFGAFAYRRTDGFGQNRASESGTFIGQYGFGGGAWRGVLHTALSAARAGLAGVVRRADVDAGRVGFYDAYPDATANAQSALSSRAQLGVTIDRRGEGGARLRLGAWTALTHLRVRTNFTGYRERSRINPDWVGRGDLNEQLNDAVSLGASASYRLRTFKPASWARGTVEVGAVARLDRIGQAQNLLQAPQNETWDQRVDADVQALDVGAFVDLDWRFARVLRLRGGVRADALAYDVDDRLGNFIPRIRPDSYIVGYRRTAFGLAAGPRATLEYAPSPVLSAFASYGEGFRSPQARTLDEGETTPFARVRSGDVGVRYRLDTRGTLDLTAAGYLTALSTDVVFEPESARLEPVGPTTRLGAVVYATSRPWSWLTASGSLTFVRATLDAPPVPTNANPNPPYVEGQLLPYVPPVVLRLDVGAKHALMRFGGGDLTGRVGVGFSYLSSRPLPFGAFAEPVALLDASASLRWRAFELGVEGFNLADTRYAAIEYSFASAWSTTETPSRLPARHLSAGAPLTLLATLGVTL
jgi:TonB family protein